MKPPQYKKSDVESFEQTASHQGYFRLDVRRMRHRNFSGDWGGEIRREIFERGHAVAVLPYDPVRDEVILIEQFRPGAYAALDSPWFDESETSPWLIELVAGIIEVGEQPEDVARRECLEETGTPIGDLVPVSHFLVSPGGSSESVFCYVGRTSTANVAGIHGVPDEGEDIRPFTVALDDAYAAVESGLINNSSTIVVIQWLMLNRDRVLARWRNAGTDDGTA